MIYCEWEFISNAAEVAPSRIMALAQSLSDIPRIAAERFLNKKAVVDGSTELSFIEVERRVALCAADLRGIGIKTGERVILHLPNGWEWIVAYYAIARLGAIVVPANILLAADEIAFMASDCGAIAVVTLGQRVPLLKTAYFSGENLIFVAVGDIMGEAATHRQSAMKCSAFNEAEAVSADMPSTIGYTSGTTGRPKGAVLTHQSIVMNSALTGTIHGRSMSDTVVSALPCTHVYGNVVLNSTFLTGATLVLMARFDAEDILEAIEKHRATIFDGVPTMYFYLLGASSLSERKLSSLVRCTVGGQTMPLPQMEEAQRRLGCPLHELWGMTEIGGLGTTHPALVAPRLGSIGVPLPLSECRIAALEGSDKSVPLEEVGELQIRGPTVMQGYYGQPKATAEAFATGGWLRTGDLARRDQEGYLYVVDRWKEMIIAAGYNIYPSELERVIASHRAVQMVAVAGIPDPAKGEVPKAYIVLHVNAQVTEDEIIAHCREHLAAYKVPRQVQFVSDLPKTSTGKLLRRSLSSLEEAAVVGQQ
jgi:long-chain acyl-CoA synthetase